LEWAQFDSINSLATKVEKQFEEFWLNHQPKPRPTPKPDPAPEHGYPRVKPNIQEL
jgi:hypothetical protein